MAIQVKIDNDRFDELQMYLTKQLVETVRDGLRKAGVTDEQILYEEAGNLAFSIAAIFDGSAVMELDGQPVVPILTFAPSRGAEELISAGGGSWMHEYVFGVADELDDEDE